MAEYGDLKLLRVDVEDGVAVVTIDNPPMNLLSVDLMRELNGLHRIVQDDDAVRVVVLVSADPDFFIAHAEAGDIEALEEDLSPPRTEIVGLHRLMERWRTCSKPTIAQLEGRTRGGGSEFAMSLDMRYAAIGKAGSPVRSLPRSCPTSFTTWRSSSRRSRRQRWRRPNAACLPDAPTRYRV